jgi:accessory gene regulator B
MITGLAKSTACFFVANKFVEAEDEEVYAYGMELLLSTVFNLIVAIAIAGVTHTFIPCLINLTAFVTIRIYAGGYHADTHRGCILTLAVVQAIFIVIVKSADTEILKMFIPFMLLFAIDMQH